MPTTGSTNDVAGDSSTSNTPSNSSSATSSPSPSRPAGQQQPPQHRPAQPSNLRQSHMPPLSPEATRSQPDVGEDRVEDGVDAQDHADVEQAQDGPDAHTSLLANYGVATAERHNDTQPYIFRHRPRYTQGYGSFASSYAPTEAGSFEQRPSLGGGFLHSNRQDSDGGGITDSVPEAVTDGLLGRPKKNGRTHWLARMGGIRSERMMCVAMLQCHDTSFLRMLIKLLGTFTTTFPSLTGCGNTGGSLSRVISYQL